MHIMIVIHSLAGGGAERVAVDLAAYWLKLGHRVSLVTQKTSDTDAYQPPAGVHRFELATAGDSGGGWRGAIANLRRVYRLRRVFKRQKPDCILGMMTTASILSVVAAKNLNCKVIVSEHTHPPAQRLPPIWVKLRRWAYPRADAVVALTSGTATWLSAHVPGSRPTVIPNSVRWPLTAGEPRIVPPDREGRLRLLAVGRLHPVKGFDILIQAFALLAKYFPAWDLTIVGEGPERASLQAQIDELSLGSQIELVGRVGNIRDWYEASDLYVLSSRTEGLSNTLLEAMACGLPVVAFDCETGPREIVRTGIDGVLVSPAEDPEALAAHLSDLMAHPSKRSALAKRAIDVRDRFSATRIMAQWEQLLHKPGSPSKR